METIGIVVFLFNIVLYVITWALLLARFYYYPYTFKASFLHPTESLFIPASVVSFGTILVNISQYGPDHTGLWLSKAVGVLFWINAALAIALSAGIYLILYVPGPAYIKTTELKALIWLDGRPRPSLLGK